MSGLSDVVIECIFIRLHRASTSLDALRHGARIVNPPVQSSSGDGCPAEAGTAARPSALAAKTSRASTMRVQPTG